MSAFCEGRPFKKEKEAGARSDVPSISSSVFFTHTFYGTYSIILSMLCGLRGKCQRSVKEDRLRRKKKPGPGAIDYPR
jgi:hypothetical protein